MIYAFLTILICFYLLSNKVKPLKEPHGIPALSILGHADIENILILLLRLLLLYISPEGGAGGTMFPKAPWQYPSPMQWAVLDGETAWLSPEPDALFPPADTPTMKTKHR